MSFGHKGSRDWIIQRATAVYLAGYMLFLLYFWLMHTEISENNVAWPELFSGVVMKVSTFVALIALLIHAWIGIWTIITDYISCYCIRIGLLSVIGFCLVGYLAWGLSILWG